MTPLLGLLFIAVLTVLCWVPLWPMLMHDPWRVIPVPGLAVAVVPTLTTDWEGLVL